MPEKFKLLGKRNQAKTGCELKRFKLNDTNEIIISDNTKLLSHLYYQ